MEGQTETEGSGPDGASAGRERPVVRMDLDWRTAVAVAVALVGAVALVAAARTARSALTWIVLGTLFALALEPVVAALQRVVRRRWAAVGVVTLVGLALTITVAVLVVPIAAREAGRFAEDAPRLVERLSELPLVGDRLVELEAPERIEEWVRELPGELGTDDAPLVGAFRSALGGLTAAIATVAMILAVLLDGGRLRDGLRRLVPPTRRDGLERALDIVYATVGRYFAGSLLIAVLAGCGILVVGLIAGVPLAPVAAAWVMVTNLIPQVGGFLGGALFVLLGATQGPGTLLICLVWFLAYQQFENNVLQPVIVGDAVDLSPPITMIAALVGAAAFGVPGALVAIPLLGTSKAIAVELGWVRPRSEAESESAGHRPGRLRRLLGRRPRT
jgi:predicted PurR-regulated permease PerM